ncbi:hypothetical protein [Ekhidna sp. MALMAid0563]|uniref:hypothetical protein n=1 Tax=Ekhidna sp. MALMAid0563 TaxID=3143937 RepID=UPI0032DFEDE9
MISILFAIDVNAQLNIDDLLNVNNTDPYFTYGSGVDQVGAYSNTLVGFMSVYYLKGIGMNEKN